MDKAIKIWGNVGLQNLQGKYLLDVDNENKINMYDHIRDLGRKFVKEVIPLSIWGSTTNITEFLIVILTCNYFDNPNIFLGFN